MEADRPVSVLARMRFPSGYGVLHDAMSREDARQAMLRLIERKAVLELGTARTAAEEVAASLASAATGMPAREARVRGEAAAVLEHPERATHGAAGPGEVHLRPHEVVSRRTRERRRTLRRRRRRTTSDRIHLPRIRWNRCR